jgi:excisionase family DNA binding protein
LNPPSATIESDFRKDLPVKRKNKTSVKALAYGLLRADQVAEILGLSIQTVRGLWRDGQLGYIQFTKKQRLSSKEQIEEYLQSKTATTALPPPKPVLRPIRDRQFKTPAKTSIEDVRRKLSSWDESSDSDNDKT